MLSLWTAPAASAGAALEAGRAAPAVIRVTIENMTFTPAAIRARAGDTIEWTNKDVVDHTATSVRKAFDVTIAPGTSAKTIVKRAGVIEYVCRFHPNMKGRVTVKK